MQRRFLYGALVGAGTALVALLLWAAGAFDRLENATWAWRVRLLARPSAATEKIRIILLDQASLDWGSEQNGWSWPWPREVYGPILDFCARGGARVVAFDVLYTEPSVYGVADDEALEAAIRRTPRFLGALTLANAPGGASKWPPDAPELPWNVLGLNKWATDDHAAPGATFPIPEVVRSAFALGNAGDRPDEDGVFRRATLLRVFDGRGVPSLGLAAYLAGRDAPRTGEDLRVESNALRVGSLRVPIDEAGRAILRFAGPTGVHPTVSAASVIQSELRLQEGGEPVVDAAFFKDAYVFFGFSAPGLLDLRPTPLSRVSPGVEIHATVLDNLLSEGFLRKPSPASVILGTLLLALLGGLLIALSRKAWLGALIFVLLLPLPALAGLAGYRLGFWWPVVTGEAALLLSLVGALVVNYALEGRQKHFIKQAFKLYLSPHVIERILKDPSQLRLGGDRRTLSIFFSDLEGFTSIS